VKGPDVGNKSERTQRRYRDLLKGQMTLESLGFSKMAPKAKETDEAVAPEVEFMPSADTVELLIKEEGPAVILSELPSASASAVTYPVDDVAIRQETPETLHLSFSPAIRSESLTPPPLLFDNDCDMDEPPLSPETVHVRVESVTPPPLSFDKDREVATSHKRNHATCEDAEDCEDNRAADNQTAGQPAAASEQVGSCGEEEDGWEDEIHENLSPKADIQGWEELRTQIKDDLKKKSLPLSQINQLMILRNFATLRIKGHKRMDASAAITHQWHEKDTSNTHFARRICALAHHFQVFEQLPCEQRGSDKDARCLLKDESVRAATRSWLTEQKVGSITPRNFQGALNTIILPSLGIALKKPLCERTARRWLVKLGWMRTVLRKGVYMDGHEREDVVKYCNSIFLPRMQEYERRMARYEGPDLKHIEPILAEGEKELISEFQDETCCQANEHVSSAWWVSY